MSGRAVPRTAPAVGARRASRAHAAPALAAGAHDVVPRRGRLQLSHHGERVRRVPLGAVQAARVALWLRQLQMFIVEAAWGGPSDELHL